MKVGDVVVVDGEKRRVTWAQGPNYSYEILKDLPNQEEKTEVPTRGRKKKEV